MTALTNALPRTSSSKIILAVLLSALIHAIALFVPLVELAPVEAPLPPLIARLEPLPKNISPPVPVRRIKPKPVLPEKAAPWAPTPTDAPPTDQTTDQPADQTTEPAAEPATEQITEQEAAPSGRAEAPQAEAPQIAAEPPPAIEAPTDRKTEEIRPAHPLPKRARLTFIAYKGTDFEVGEVRHRLEIHEGKSYTIDAGMNTTGLASFFKTFELNQQSTGIMTAQGLRPGSYSETKNTSKGKEALDARFDWEEKILVFSNGSRTPLPEQAQDIVSFLYQLSQLPLDQGTLPIYISNGKKLERYELAIGVEEMIQTRLGRLHALPVRKIHAQGEEGLEIWLGLEYRLLPIKISHIDRSGHIAGEMVISEIRVADD